MKSSYSDWNSGAKDIIKLISSEKKEEARIIQLGTNWTFQIGEEFFRISRPENKQIVERGWQAALQITKKDPSLIPRPLYHRHVRGFDVWVFRFIKGASRPDNFDDLDCARKRAQKALAEVEGLGALERWPGPLRGMPMYLEGLAGRAPKEQIDNLQRRYSAIPEYVRQGRWAGEAVRIHGDFSAKNCLLTGEGNIMVVDWDCIQEGPAWADQIKLWSSAPEEYTEWFRARELARDAFALFAQHCLRPTSE